MDNLLNDISILGLRPTKMAEYHIWSGDVEDGVEVFKIEVEIVGIEISESEEEEMITHFNNSVRCLEYTKFVSYSFFPRSGGSFVKSNSLDELFEMFKADWTGQPIPERKCNVKNHFRDGK